MFPEPESRALSRQAIGSVGGLRLSGQYLFGPSDHLAWAFCFVRNFKPLAGGAPAFITGCTMFRGIMVAGLMLVATGAVAADRQADSGACPSEFEARMISIREAMDDGHYGERMEKRREGEECVLPCTFRWWPFM